MTGGADPLLGLAKATLADLAEEEGWAAGGRREDRDDYAGQIARAGRWRVIRCRDGLQRVVGQRRGKAGGRARWDAVHYCRTRSALLRLC